MSQPPSAGPGSYGPGPSSPLPPPTNAKATASLITGVATLVLSWCCGLGLVGLVAVALGAKARREIAASGGGQQGDGMALAGIITGAVAAVLGLLILVFIVIALMAGVDLESATRGTSA